MMGRLVMNVGLPFVGNPKALFRNWVTCTRLWEMRLVQLSILRLDMKLLGFHESCDAVMDRKRRTRPVMEMAEWKTGIWSTGLRTAAVMMREASRNGLRDDGKVW